MRCEASIQTKVYAWLKESKGNEIAISHHLTYMNGRPSPVTPHLKTFFSGVVTGMAIAMCLYFSMHRNGSRDGRAIERASTTGGGSSEEHWGPDAAARTRSAARKLELERQNEIGRLSTYGERISLLGTDGRINPQAAAEIGLKSDQLAKVQGVIDSAWERMGRILSGSVKYSERDSIREGVGVYHIEPPVDDAKQEMSRLQADLELVVGGGLATKVIESSRLKDFFGGFGRQRITVRLVPVSDDWSGVHGTRVAYECRDPLTGDVIRSGTTSPEEFSAQFGVVFRPQ